MQEERMLEEKAIELLQKSNDDRIKYINERIFIDYNYTGKVFQAIFDLLDQPIGPRMDGLLIHSPTNNGKTTLVKKFIRDNADRIDGRFLYIETPERVTLKEFFAETLNQLGYPVTSTRSTGDLRRKILIGLKERKIKCIFFDEIQNLLKSPRDHKSDILDGLKSLNNRAEIPIILVGIDDAIRILAEDEQVADRYFPVKIPLWHYDRKSEEDSYNKDYLDLIYTFEKNLLLKKPSNLTEEKMAEKIFELSAGKIGRIAKIIRKSAVQAIRSETEKITASLIDSIDFHWTVEE